MAKKTYNSICPRCKAITDSKKYLKPTYNYCKPCKAYVQEFSNCLDPDFLYMDLSSDYIDTIMDLSTYSPDIKNSEVIKNVISKIFNLWMGMGHTLSSSNSSSKLDGS
jgi:hypothetical protein